MADKDKDDSKETVKEERNKDAGLGDILSGNSDEHGQATNRDGTPVKETVEKEK